MRVWIPVITFFLIIWNSFPQLYTSPFNQQHFSESENLAAYEEML